MPIEERIRTLLESWAQQTGIRVASSPGTAAGDSDRAAAALSNEALLERLQRHTGLAHAAERLDRVQQMAQDIFDQRAKVTRRPVTPVQPGVKAPGGASSPVSPAEAALFSVPDQALAEKLTKTQTNLKRLHSDFADAAAHVARTPVLPAAQDGGRKMIEAERAAIVRERGGLASERTAYQAAIVFLFVVAFLGAFLYSRRGDAQDL